MLLIVDFTLFFQNVSKFIPLECQSRLTIIVVKTEHYCTVSLQCLTKCSVVIIAVSNIFQMHGKKARLSVVNLFP
jgi:hypothetical protein